MWRIPAGDPDPAPFVVLDLGHDPARLDFTDVSIPLVEDGEPPELHDRGSEGLAIYLGTRGERVWHLLVDGGEQRAGPLPARTREDVLFLAGECAGLLFLRDFADEVE